MGAHEASVEGDNCGWELDCSGQWMLLLPVSWACEGGDRSVTGLFLSLLAMWERLPVIHKAWRRRNSAKPLSTEPRRQVGISGYWGSSGGSGKSSLDFVHAQVSTPVKMLYSLRHTRSYCKPYITKAQKGRQGEQPRREQEDVSWKMRAGSADSGNQGVKKQRDLNGVGKTTSSKVNHWTQTVPVLTMEKEEAFSPEPHCCGSYSNVQCEWHSITYHRMFISLLTVPGNDWALQDCYQHSSFLQCSNYHIQSWERCLVLKFI